MGPAPSFRKHVEIHPQASSAEDFLDLLKPRVQRERRDEFIYRGIGNVAHALVPSALRRSECDLIIGPNSSAYSMASDVATLLKFVVACDRSGLPVPGDGPRLRDTLKESYWVERGWPEQWPPEEHRQVWAVAQHHGLPTRLLDWTRNPIIAAYFAAVSCLKSDPSATQELAVWALDRQGEAEIWGDQIAVVEIPAAHSPNLAAQAGLFTMPLVLQQQQLNPALPFPRMPPLEAAILDCIPRPILMREGDEELGELLSLDVLLSRYTLQAEHARDLLYLCRQYGVSGATMFPGYDGAVKEVEEQSLLGPFSMASTMASIARYAK